MSEAVAAVAAEPAKEAPTAEVAAVSGSPTLLAEGAKAPEAVTPAKGADATTPAKVEPPVVPEKYDLKLPEGSQLDAARVEKIASFAKERGLSNEQAQVILERESSAVNEHVEAQKAQFEQRKAGWMSEIQADKEIGGEAFKENAERAKRVVDRFGSDTFKKILNDTGLGNHPELVRLFSRIGKDMAEDRMVLPNASSSGEAKRIQDVFYPNMKKEN